VVPDLDFIDRDSAKKNDARQLLIQAFDFVEPQEEIKVTKQRTFESIASALPQESFPPCIKLILKGLKDGRKRSLFLLVNFLTSVGWDYDAIEELLREWNAKHTEALSETLIMGQIRYHKAQKKNMLPPNCDNDGYYIAFGVCKPDWLCAKIKNPVNYSIIKSKMLKKDEKTSEKTKKDVKE